MFVGSSRESSDYIEKIEEQLCDTVRVMAWNKSVFDPGLENYLSDIIKGIDNSNCALFIYAPDDKRIIRKKGDYVTRDNVVFETGIAIGILGKKRVFIIAHNNTTLPKDLDGLTIYKLNPDKKGSFNNSLKKELIRLKMKLDEIQEELRKSPVYLSEYIQDKIYKGVSTSKVIWAISPMLSSFLDSHEPEIVRRLVSSSNPLDKIVAVLRDPNGNTINLISSHNNKYAESKSVNKKINASLSVLQELKNKHPDKVEIRVIDHPFICSSYIFDPDTIDCHVCIQYNPFGEVDRLPQIFVPCNRPFWSDFYIKQGYEYIRNSKPYPAAYTAIELDGDCEFSEKKTLLTLWETGYQCCVFRGEKSALERLKQNTLVILAKDNDKLIGFSIVDISTGKRRATVVERSYRRKGVAMDMVRLSIRKVPKQFSEVHLYSKWMQIVLQKIGFKRITSETEIRNILGRTDLIISYDRKNDILKYKRKTSQGTESVWLVLYIHNY